MVLRLIGAKSKTVFLKDRFWAHFFFLKRPSLVCKNLFINDLPLVCKNFQILLFADDTNIEAVGCSVENKNWDLDSIIPPPI